MQPGITQLCNSLQFTHLGSSFTPLPSQPKVNWLTVALRPATWACLTSNTSLSLKNGKNVKARASDVHPIHVRNDPTITTKMNFPSFTELLYITPTSITPGTPPPLNITHAKRYPYAQLWINGYDAALRKVYKESVVDWEANRQPIPNHFLSRYY